MGYYREWPVACPLCGRRPAFKKVAIMSIVSTFVVDSASIEVPPWVEDLESFRRWTETDEFPETGRVCFLRDRLWIDMSKEQAFSHSGLKGEFYRVISGLVKTAKSGLYFPDGMLLTSLEADFSCQPDLMFVSNATLRRKLVRLTSGADGGYVEVEGCPDMVLEVVSQSSVDKDTVPMRELYWQAGIREYWLADGRDDRLQFDILKHASKGYVAARHTSGWLKSTVFGKSFKLTRETNRLGYPEFTLSIR